MPYVMVPVPEEHVQEVMEFVIRTVARASIDAWTTESMEQAFLEIDEASRSLLSVVSRGVLSGKEITDRAAAEFLQLSQRETSGILREVNDFARERKRPVFISSASATEELPNGRTRKKTLLTMTPQIAQLVRTAERAALAHEPHPLESRGG